ncbi:hypothetical protein E4U53_000373 [Claviceps sorghi]|nr:hypothetical protein E4U53_000373 [Claviceps sorghi]
MSSRQAALSLYRRSLKLALDWAVQRQLWRGQALYIRSLFEANRNVTDSRQQRVGHTAAGIWHVHLTRKLTVDQALLSETEKLLDTWKHPDPYIPPTAPGGSKYERNLPSPPHPITQTDIERESGIFAIGGRNMNTYPSIYQIVN